MEFRKGPPEGSGEGFPVHVGIEDQAQENDLTVSVKWLASYTDGLKVNSGPLQSVSLYYVSI